MLIILLLWQVIFCTESRLVVIEGVDIKYFKWFLVNKYKSEWSLGYYKAWDSKDSDKVSGKGQHGGFEGKGLANHFTKAGFAVAWSSLVEEDEGSNKPKH